MRQIFRSRRLENVEGVARLLGEHGIETHISQPRSYKGNRRRQFSFADHNASESSLWIVRGDDISRARQVMAEAGLLQTERAEASFVLQGHNRTATPENKRHSTARKIRLALLVIVVVLASVHVARWMLGIG